MAKIRFNEKTGTWMIDYYDPRGQRIRKCFKKRKDAEGELAKRVTLIHEGKYLDVVKERLTPFGELLDRYEEIFSKQASWKAKRLYVQNFRAHFGADTLIANISYYDLEAYRDKIRERPVRPGPGRPGKPRTTAAVNREISCLHHVFSKGIEWGLLEKSPFNGKTSLHTKENNARTRYLEPDEIRKLLESSAPHLRNIIVCALHTGMRKEEILSLTWAQIKGDFVYLRKTKTNEARQIPINGALADLFREIKKGQPAGTKYVFTFEPVKKKEAGPLKVVKVEGGGRINSVKTAWRSALAKAGIVDCKFHDLRHTFASHLVMAGAGLRDVQEILGHKSLSMTMRYAHLSSAHKKKAVELLNELTASQNGYRARNGQSADYGQGPVAL